MSAPILLPRRVHRAALQRLLRLTSHHGLAEALEFYDALPPTDQRVVVGLAVRSLLPHVDMPPPDEASPMWTAEELRRCHNLFEHGHGERTPWVRTGERLYRRLLKRQQRDRRAAGQAAERGSWHKGPLVDLDAAKGPSQRRLWSSEDDAKVLATPRKTARALAAELDRTVGAIEHRRRELARREQLGMTG